MRGVLLVAMFTASLAHAAWNDFVEVRDLKTDADGVRELAIEAGAGSLEISGDPNADAILVIATVTVANEKADKAREIMESDMVLTLERNGDTALLKSYFKSDGSWGWGAQNGIALEVRVPERLGLAVDDGAGSMEIRDVRGDIKIDDGSGSIVMTAVGGNIEVDDGSGSISIDGAGDDIRIVDGSGSIRVRQVGGSVIVADGSGSIDVRDVGRDLIVEEDGSGGLRFADVQGRVEQDR